MLVRIELNSSAVGHTQAEDDPTDTGGSRHRLYRSGQTREGVDLRGAIRAGLQFPEPRVDAALREEMRAELRRLQQQIGVIEAEQNRIRQNMAQLEKNTDLYNKYVKKFTEQEDLNDKLRAEIQKLSQDESNLRKKLDDYLINLTIA